jgi:hypothetical protein
LTILQNSHNAGENREPQFCQPSKRLWSVWRCSVSLRSRGILRSLVVFHD